MQFKKFNDFVNESLAFLTLKKTMKNEFMNNMELKADFETAKRLFYMYGNCMFTHISSNEFELRSSSHISNEEVDSIIQTHINTITHRIKFRRASKSKRDKIKEFIWLVKANIE
jgi:translation elongation factor EF-Ts